MTFTEKQELSQEIKELIETSGITVDLGEDPEDLLEDLNETDLDTWFEQMYIKSERPRRPVPII